MFILQLHSTVVAHASVRMFSRPLLLLVALLLSLQACSADRLLRAAVLDCSQVHPACTSCSVRRRIVDGLSYSSLICKSCEQPRYVLYANGTTTTCGKLLHDVFPADVWAKPASTTVWLAHALATATTNQHSTFFSGTAPCSLQLLSS